MPASSRPSRELDESAVIDGASRLTLFWRIIFPLMRPATATVIIFLSLWTWNEFLLPLIIVGPARGVTITTGIYTAVGTYTSDYGQILLIDAAGSHPYVALLLCTAEGIYRRINRRGFERIEI